MTAQEALKTYFGYSSFRPMQEDIVNAVISGRDTLALMPTGGGKSLCFQIPTIVMASLSGDTEDREQRGGVGLCLVVTPLIALMKDQVENLRKRDIHAAAIYTGMSSDRQQQVLDNCQYGPYRFLYVSPERLESEAFRRRLSYLPICLVAVDEAHCILQWGYDFRPSYLNIAKVRECLAPSPYKNMPVPVLALTATATPQVADDICLRLSLEGEEVPDWKVFKQSFARENLCYIVRRCADSADKTRQLVNILNKVQGSAIVYVRNRKRTAELCEILVREGIDADYYHAGLDSYTRTLRQQHWKDYGVQPEGKRVIVCTNAFGMGIDKPDVRSVIHFDLPDSPEAYFQETGRAGRDGKEAYAVLLFAADDAGKMKKRVIDTYPPEEFIQIVYQKLSDYFVVGEGSGWGHSFTLHLDDLCRVMHLPVLQTYSALHLLDNAGFIAFQEEHETQPRVRINVPPYQLATYKLTAAQNDLMQTLMRKYTGIFTDLQYLYEQVTEDMHQTLVSLAQRRIITYIPRTVANTVTYTQPRVDKVWLPKRVYEERQQAYVERIKAMTEYATQTSFCRRQLLLSYFGETDAPLCGKCDVCRKKNKTS